ncbi:hypothetical protein SAMN04487848_2501 [Microbacterium sp. ru370.1]|uniref:hypothetical protein n=1 Tax=Microbacterium sp. ru370.1 TaxID=1761809 RepID=UPI0008901F73|nr:hypothetical protein [Microbacterium sp. ru370.1]SDO91309.1 hypothetical protein SAMN04487848_2501 [Microbacterium sp. ru370.1]SIT93388.1 hypothetical protein SAMN05880579_3077 [Microbacterium sp. RU1D]
MMAVEAPMVLSIGLAVMCVALGASMIGVILPQLGSRAPVHFFLRVTSMAGVLAVGSTAMYVLAFQGGGPVALAMASTAMVLAPAMLCVAVSPPGSRRVRALVAFAAVLALVVAITTIALEPSAALTVRVLAVATACGLCAVLTARARTIPRRSAIVLAATTGGFAAYSLLRVAVSLSPLADTSLDRMVFSVEATGVVATASVLLTGLAVVLVRRSPALGGPDRSSAWTRVAFDDWSRARADLGDDGLLALLTELRMAAREADPSAVDVYRGVEIRRPSALPAVRSRLRDGYGWRAAQLSLLTESADGSRRT